MKKRLTWLLIAGTALALASCGHLNIGKGTTIFSMGVTPAMAEEAQCEVGSDVATLTKTAADQSVELVTYTGDDFTKYVNAVQKLFAPSFGDGADEVIEAVLDEDTVLVFLAKDGCLIAKGTVDRASREAVLQEAGLSK